MLFTHLWTCKQQILVHPILIHYYWINTLSLYWSSLSIKAPKCDLIKSGCFGEEKWRLLRGLLFLKLICTLGCGWRWLSLFFVALLHHCSARLPCPPWCTQRAEAEAKTCPCPVDYGMVQRQLKSPREDKCGLLQKKGKITRAGFEKRTGCTIICTACCRTPECLAVWDCASGKWEQNHSAVLLKTFKKDENREMKVKDYQTIFITPYQKFLNPDLSHYVIQCNINTSKPTPLEHRSHCQQNTSKYRLHSPQLHFSPFHRLGAITLLLFVSFAYIYCSFLIVFQVIFRMFPLAHPQLTS